MLRWNEKEHKYEPFTVPSSYICRMYSDDMDLVVNCPHCGRKVLYGNGYTSCQIFESNGLFGYAVCPECHERELKERYEYGSH